MMRRGMPKGAHFKARKGTFLRLVRFVLEKHKIRIIIVILAMALSTLTNIGATSIIQQIVKETSAMIEIGSTDFTPIIKLIAAMSGLYLLSILLTYLHLRIMIDVGQESLLRLRETMFVHMTKLPIKYFDEHQHGDLMSVFTNDVNATRQMISQSLPQLAIATFTILGYLIAMFIFSYILSFFMIAVGILLIFTSKKVTSSTRVLYRQLQLALGKVNGYFNEMVEAHIDVIVFRYEQQAVKNFEKLNHDLFIQAEKAGKKIGVLVPFTINIGYLAYVVVAILGSYLISINHMTIPQLIVFLLFTRSFVGPFNRLSNQMDFIGLATAGADRIFRILEEEIETDQGQYELVDAEYKDDKLVKSETETGLLAWYNSETNHLVKLCGDVRFDNVSFGYRENVPVLKDVSLYAKPNQKIAFVGATGAGKTTIANLINRFYDIKEGEISFDGIDIKEIKKHDLRKVIAVVLQDTSLFTTTVMENIRYGNLNATDEDVYQAAKRANAHEFILKLPEGYNTVIAHDGENLSQGQRQLLSIARAAIADVPVLILDEATSSVDTHTEKLIQDGMDQLMKGKTVFVIAHRLSTIQNSNAIIVLENGEIIERGDHDELIDYRGKYYQLYTGLFEFE